MKDLTSPPIRLLWLFCLLTLWGCGGSVTIEQPRQDQVYLKSDTT